MPNPYHSGLVALVGRPNVGKSTLLNCLVGKKVSITSHRPQTTRQRILGISTNSERQIVYVDTPGLHIAGKKAINKHMNRSASGSLVGVDCIALVITTRGWTDADKHVLELVEREQTPVVLVINKLDKLPRREQLLPVIDKAKNSVDFQFDEIIPVSATKNINIDELEKAVVSYLPGQDMLFPGDQISDRSERFMAAELVREQIFRNIEQEVPHSVAVGIELFKKDKGIIYIDAVIWIEKQGQKGIIIGNKGERLKKIGTYARKEMETLLDSKVHLELWVKIRANWRDNDRMLRSMGFGEE